MEKKHLFCRKRVFIALLFFLIFSLNYSQVLIEEEIEINPINNENHYSLNKTNAVMVNLQAEMSFNQGSYPWPLPPSTPYTTGLTMGNIEYRNKYNWRWEPYAFDQSTDGSVSIALPIKVNMANMIVRASNRNSNIGHYLGTSDILEFVGPASASITITVSGAPKENIDQR